MGLEMTPSCLKFFKLSVFALNIILWLVGTVGVCIASFYLFLTMEVANEERPESWSEGFSSAESMLLQARVVMCILVIVTGSLVIIIGFLGCCGAAADHRCLLVTYAGLLGVAMAVQVIIVGVVIWQKDQAPGIVEELVLTKIRYSMDYDHADWKPIHVAQRQMKCCGVYSYGDYVAVNHSVPLSCCNSSLTTEKDYLACNSTMVHPHTLKNVSMIFNRGCGEVIRSIISGYAILGFVVMTVLMTIQLLGFIFGCIVIRSLSDWLAPKPTQCPNRSASYTPADAVQPYRPVPPAYENPSRHSSVGALGAAR
ncbi:tetraspanin-3-like [Pollicipes pollicipes]|uniref:tetraspanin-3-like n=1 Tax=Pollicipes pollicipes TaxID=41117 RepID=UPI0018852868|nr:tetraspanin-3-like [Pollicipes pollicipes]